jgi:hypothetical protein
MKLNPIHYFLGGVALTALVAAARFAGGTPLDQTFTYQGQLRNAGQLVSGPVDLRITLWDSDTAGSQLGGANSFNSMQLTDGRFACGLNFGNAAFDGSNRWIQVEFRNPAGVGQYQTLSPRDKITATPYALYALNGANGVWVYDTNQQSVSVIGKKVGIGTGNPTAALEVVSATGGDDSVKLPAGSIGIGELALTAFPRAFDITTTPAMFSTTKAGVLVFSGTAGNTSGAGLSVDNQMYPFLNHNGGIHALHKLIVLPPGDHSVAVGTANGAAISATAIWFPTN